MSLPTPVWSETLVTDAIGIAASGAVPTKRFVGYDGAVCGAGKMAIGVAYWTAADTEQVTIYGPGNIVLVEAGDAVTAGDPVTSDSTGRAVSAGALAGVGVDGSVAVKSTAEAAAVTLSGGYVPKIVNGIALATASTAGDIIPVLVK
jgi:hypothetical protein